MPFSCVFSSQKVYSKLSDVTLKYEIGQLIKSEEYCEIYRAKDKSTGKVYACKKFIKKDGRRVRKIANNEITILKMVKHTNILQMVEAFETRKEHYVFLELATGREVFDWILDQGYYSEKDASLVIKQVLEAVAYLHSLGIVHRNLKLENIVYYNRLKHSKIVISDFHLARAEDGLIKEPCGTPEYLAPEMVGRQRYGRPVDLWATGVVIYILLSGNPPFYDDQDEEDYENHDKNLFRKILSAEFEFDSPYWDDISDAAKELVTRLMDVDQNTRITAQEAIAHPWVSGNAASDKNIKDGVCAQIEKNFAKTKWKKAVRVTAMMKHLRTTQHSAPPSPAAAMGGPPGAAEVAAAAGNEEGEGGEGGGGGGAPDPNGRSPQPGSARPSPRRSEAGPPCATDGASPPTPTRGPAAAAASRPGGQPSPYAGGPRAAAPAEDEAEAAVAAVPENSIVICVHASDGDGADEAGNELRSEM
ncbi:caM kinase-like vesicle-associated protein [Lampetra planeri]